MTYADPFTEAPITGDLAGLDANDSLFALGIVGGWIRAYTGRGFRHVENDESTLAGTRERGLVLGDAPVQSVSAVLLDGVAVQREQYRVSRRGILWRDEGWGGPECDVQLTWTHGERPPRDVQGVAITAALRLAKNPEGLTRLTVEGYDRAYAMPPGAFTVAELCVLNRYRRRTWP